MGPQSPINAPKPWQAARAELSSEQCYRLGQSRDVQVIRFIAADTLEEELYLRTYAGVDYEDFYRAHLEHDARR